jgi:hypothetical protein
MKNRLFSALVVMALGGSLLAGCGSDTSAAAASKAPANEACDARGRAGSHVYVFTGSAGAHSRVERTVRADGSEVLSGETVLRAGEGKVLESAEIDASGRLVYADVSAVDASGATLRRTLLDAARGAVFVQDGHGAAWQRVARDLPWVFAGPGNEDAPGMLAPTPVSAWVAVCATAASADVRVIDPVRRNSQVVPRDQLVATDGDESIVVADGTSIVANGEFVTSLGERPAPIAALAVVHHGPRRVALR